MLGKKFVVLVSTIALSACQNRGAESASVAVVTEAESRSGDPSAEVPPRIYYDLTQFTWYARAEPIVTQQQRYMPGGEPVAIPLAKLQLSGNYQGVDYYVARNDKEPPSTIYVPVYEGYWLSFRAASPTGD
jgi:hypothetical protein